MIKWRKEDLGHAANEGAVVEFKILEVRESGVMTSNWVKARKESGHSETNGIWAQIVRVRFGNGAVSKLCWYWDVKLRLW